MPKVKVPWLCSRSQPGIKVIIRDIRGHLLHTLTFLVPSLNDPIPVLRYCYKMDFLLLNNPKSLDPF